MPRPISVDPSPLDAAFARCVRALTGAQGRQPGAVAECRAALSELDPRLRLVSVPWSSASVLSYAEHEARGLAEQLAEALPSELGVLVGRPHTSWEIAQQLVLQETGVDVRAAKVRAGFTRGHLMEVVVALPSSPQAERAAELAVEALLGEAFVDDWIVAIGTQPLMRGGPLRVMQPSSPEADMHPLAELLAMARSAERAVLEQLPSLAHSECEPSAEWTLLEMEPAQGGAQPDRVLATTCMPELLKSALEGAPFHSRRFSRHEERFAWVATRSRLFAQERQAERTCIEEALDEALRSRGLGAVIGTGLGRHTDYFDLCLARPPSIAAYADAERDPALLVVVETLRARNLGQGGTVVGFYDTRFAERRLRV